jgi:hypothetical protein
MLLFVCFVSVCARSHLVYYRASAISSPPLVRRLRCVVVCRFSVWCCVSRVFSRAMGYNKSLRQIRKKKKKRKNKTNNKKECREIELQPFKLRAPKLQYKAQCWCWCCYVWVCARSAGISIVYIGLWVRILNWHRPVIFGDAGPEEPD